MDSGSITTSTFKTKALRAGALLVVSYILGALMHPAGIDKAITAIFTAPLAAAAFTTQLLVQLAIPALIVSGVAKLLRRKPSFRSLLIQSGIFAMRFSSGSR